MKKMIGKLVILFIISSFILVLDDNSVISFNNNLFSTAEAIVGRPATPVSYAGVARRTPVGVGVNTPYNRGGPVNRVGRR